jgi:hypothetical protein
LETDVNGEVTTDLPDATYWVRFFKAGYSFQSKLLIVVDSAEYNSFVITGNDLTELPPSAASGICRVSGFIIDAQGSPSYEPIIYFSIPNDGKRIVGRRIIGTEKVIAQPNLDGYIEVELVQNMIYEVSMYSISDEVISVRVPEQQACNITDLIYPIGKIKSVIPDDVTVAAGEEFLISVEFALSSNNPIIDPTLNRTTNKFFIVETSSTNLIATVLDTGIRLFSAEPSTYTVKIFGKCAGDIYDVDGPFLLKELTATVV